MSNVLLLNALLVIIWHSCLRKELSSSLVIGGFGKLTTTSIPRLVGTSARQFLDHFERAREYSSFSLMSWRVFATGRGNRRRGILKGIL